MAIESVIDKLDKLTSDLRTVRKQVEKRSRDPYLGVGAMVQLPRGKRQLISMYATDIKNGIEVILFENGRELVATRIRYQRIANHKAVSRHVITGDLPITILQESREFHRQTLSLQATVSDAPVSRNEMVFIDDCIRHAISVAATYKQCGTSWQIFPQSDIRVPVREFNKRLPNHSNAYKLWLNYRDLSRPPEQKMLTTGFRYSVHHIKGGEYEDGIFISVVGDISELTDKKRYPNGPLLRIHSACCFSEQGRKKGYVTHLEEDAAHTMSLNSEKYAFIPYRATPSESCDCRLQMEESQRQIAQHGGIFADFYEQEGRGYGLLNKEEFFYRLNEQEGWDTAEVCERYGINPDIRIYKNFAAWLFSLGVRRVQLLGNNPRKKKALERAGIKVMPIALWMPTAGNLSYLKVKRDKLQHNLPTDAELRQLLD